MRLVSLIIAQLFNGLQTGSIFALVALGYSMVYGIIMLLNFAHGDIIMIGAYTTFYAMTTFHLHPVFSLVLAVCVSTVLGVVIEKVAYTPLRSAPRLSLLITAILVQTDAHQLRCTHVLRNRTHGFSETSPLYKKRQCGHREQRDHDGQDRCIAHRCSEEADAAGDDHIHALCVRAKQKLRTVFQKK